MKKLFPIIVSLLVLFTFGCKKTTEMSQIETKKIIEEKQNVNDFVDNSTKDDFSDFEGKTTSISEVASKFKVNVEGAFSLKTFFVTKQTGNEIIVMANFIKTNGLVDAILLNKLLNNEKTDFNGIVIHKNDENRYLFETVYKDGQIVKTLYLEGRPGNENVINSACINYYLVEYHNGIAVGWTYLYSICSGGCEQTRFINNEEYPLTAGCGGGGGGGNNSNNDDGDNIAELLQILDGVNNQCLKATLNQVISSNLNNSITDILHNTFGATDDFNINFIDAGLNNPMKDGNTSTLRWPSGRLDFEITLNTEVLPDASKEYTAATIYHEITHAYLTTTGVATGTGLQHIAMANNYVTKLTSSLISAFPGLDPLDAKALAWGGLQGTPAFDSIQINHPTEYTDLLVRNSQHRVSTKGTPCP